MQARMQSCECLGFMSNIFPLLRMLSIARNIALSVNKSASNVDFIIGSVWDQHSPLSDLMSENI